MDEEIMDIASDMTTAAESVEAALNNLRALRQRTVLAENWQRLQARLEQAAPLLTLPGWLDELTNAIAADRAETEAQADAASW